MREVSGGRSPCSCTCALGFACASSGTWFLSVGVWVDPQQHCGKLRPAELLHEIALFLLRSGPVRGISTKEWWVMRGLGQQPSFDQEVLGVGDTLVIQILEQIGLHCRCSAQRARSDQALLEQCLGRARLVQPSRCTNHLPSYASFHQILQRLGPRRGPDHPQARRLAEREERSVECVEGRACLVSLGRGPDRLLASSWSCLRPNCRGCDLIVAHKIDRH